MSTQATPTQATPTQVKRPWRATFRTAVQTAIAVIPVLGYVVPEIIQIVLEEAGETVPPRLRLLLLAAAAVVVAIASIAARVMAIPAVEAFLASRGLARSLAANPAPRPSTLDYHLED